MLKGLERCLVGFKIRDLCVATHWMERTQAVPLTIKIVKDDTALGTPVQQQLFRLYSCGVHNPQCTELLPNGFLAASSSNINSAAHPAHCKSEKCTTKRVCCFKPWGRLTLSMKNSVNLEFRNVLHGACTWRMLTIADIVGQSCCAFSLPIVLTNSIQ